MTINVIRYSLCALLLAGIAGCSESGPQIAPASGVVLLDDVPLTSGVVSFTSPTGHTASVPLDDEGRFELVSQYGKGVPLGSYRVTVLPPGIPPAMNMTSPKKRTKEPIPEKYQYPDRSGLIAEVKEAGNDFRFELSSEG